MGDHMAAQAPTPDAGANLLALLRAREISASAPSSVPQLAALQQELQQAQAQVQAVSRMYEEEKARNAAADELLKRMEAHCEAQEYAAMEQQKNLNAAVAEAVRAKNEELEELRHAMYLKDGVVASARAERAVNALLQQKIQELEAIAGDAQAESAELRAALADAQRSLQQEWQRQEAAAQKKRDEDDDRDNWFYDLDGVLRPPCKERPEAEARAFMAEAEAEARAAEARALELAAAMAAELAAAEMRLHRLRKEQLQRPREEVWTGAELPKRRRTSCEDSSCPPSRAGSDGGSNLAAPESPCPSEALALMTASNSGRSSASGSAAESAAAAATTLPTAAAAEQEEEEEPSGGCWSVAAEQVAEPAADEPAAGFPNSKVAPPAGPRKGAWWRRFAHGAARGALLLISCAGAASTATMAI